MNDLELHIRELIASRGALSVATYMDIALQHEEHGYYRRREPLGSEGDFITAPEVSQMFGEIIGLWLADTWIQMGKPEAFVLLELGPGRGTLLQDALRATVKIEGFHEAMKLVLIESNIRLRRIQQDKLSAYGPHYIEHIGQLPDLPVLAVANEFFDALPIRQFERSEKGWSERLVGLEGNRLCFVTSSPDRALLLIPEDIRYGLYNFYEFSPEGMHIMHDLSGHIVKYGGAGLFIDYGFDTPPSRPTFQAVARHKKVDVLECPGEVDLTAHVDFGALKKAALAQRAKVSSLLGQGTFLKAMGIEFRAERLKKSAALEQAKEIESALYRLVDPSQMGDLFKVMAIFSPQLSAIAGFNE